ncbi:MAG: glycine zipper 2TM domain-containing protein [Rhodoferax sp.]|uniref:glycine zipper 2TM domain-containing protein n=1 Tax=Rhodoferax sp. TaxID=50421 RepID=UPI001B5497FB|nr:glycine zipper 2TM domain-containing protein [Rhodoferax sp.]MBP9904694.1 glycine zipper 2TM domain-containing protein [Rhodoferax sp.]
MTNQAFDAPAPAGNNKTLWAAIAVLGVAVLAMGATLIRIQNQPVEPRVAMADLPTTLQNAASAASAPANTASAETIITETAQTPASTPMAVHTQPVAKAENIKPKSTPAHTSKEPKATHHEADKTAEVHASASPQPVQLPAEEPAVARAPEPNPPVCATCGTVERVISVEQEGSGTGLGAIAGGVLGAVVGNQVGGGDGRKLATVLGAVGGGLAGNSVEKNMKKTIHYRVVVRMDDGSTRTIERNDPAMVGAKVQIEGNSLRVVNR